MAALTITKKDAILLEDADSYVLESGGLLKDAILLEANPAPIITSLHPNQGSPGDRIRIKGSVFGALQGSSKVYFGALEATVDTWSATEIACFVPAITDDCNVKVVT